MSNDFSSKTPEFLQQLCSTVANSIGSGSTNPYGVPHDDVEALGDASFVLGSTLNEQAQAKAALRAITLLKGHKKEGVVDALNAIAKIVYDNPDVTNNMIASLGFAPRKAKSQPKAPVAVTDLAVTPFADGTARLAWDRSGNRKGASFLIEASDDGQVWTMIDSTTRVSYTATGFAPGVPTWFRVTASNGVGRALPSAKVSMYAPDAPARPVLKLAA